MTYCDTEAAASVWPLSERLGAARTRQKLKYFTPSINTQGYVTGREDEAKTDETGEACSTHESHEHERTQIVFR
jgi:hypothetical protein